MGSGNDTININRDFTSVLTGSGDDVIDISGAYADIHAGEGDDTIITSSMGASIFTGDGNDVIELRTPSTEIQMDSFRDPSDIDRIQSNGFTFTGDGHTLSLYGDVSEVLLFSPNDTMFVSSSDAHAVYDGGWTFGDETGSHSGMVLYSDAGNQLGLWDYAPGAAGLSATNAFEAPGYSLESLTGGSYVNIEPTELHPYGGFSTFRGFGAVSINYADQFPGGGGPIG